MSNELDLYNISLTVGASNFKFGKQRGFGVQRTKKQPLRPKLAVVSDRGASEKM